MSIKKYTIIILISLSMIMIGISNISAEKTTINYISETNLNTNNLDFLYNTLQLNEPPHKPCNINPTNNSINVSINVNLTVCCYDPNGDPMDIYFYNAENDSLIGVHEDVSQGFHGEIVWTNLDYNKSYSWYAIANDSEFENKSDTWHFTTLENPMENNPPNQPSDPIPAHEETGVNNNPVLSVVVSDPDGDSLNVSFYNASDDSLIGVDNDVVSGGLASVTWSDLDLNMTYSWYVIVNDSEYEIISDEWNFTTSETPINSPPDQPINPSPSDEETGVDTDPVLSVVVSDPDGDSLNVSFYNASDDSLIGVDNDVVSGGLASVTWSDLDLNMTYSWYVIVNDSEYEIISDEWNFTTSETPINSPPDQPINPSPSDEETGVDTDPVLSVVVSDPDGDSLNVSFYNASDDSLIGVDNDVVSGGLASVTWSDLDLNMTYSWYVIVNDSREENSSDIWEFKTINIILKIEISGGIGVNALISNIGADDAKNVEWDISIKSKGILGIIDESSEGNIDLIEAKDDIIAKKLLVRGLGFVDIIINADCDWATEVTETSNAIILGYFVILY